MAKKAKKKTAAKTATRSGKTKKVIAVKSVKAKAKKAPAKKPAAKQARRSSADVAKLRKAIRVGLKARKTAAGLADELGISKAYVYMLKNRA